MLDDLQDEMMSGASGGFRGTSDTAASVAASSAAAWALLLRIILAITGVFVGGGLILIGACISASPPRSLAGPVSPVGTILAVRWPNKGWSRPLLPDHGELAASEQAQLEAARARRGWRPIRRALSSQFNTSTHRRSHLLESTTHSRRSSLDIIPQSHNHASAELQPHSYIFATSAVERIEEPADGQWAAALSCAARAAGQCAASQCAAGRCRVPPRGAASGIRPCFRAASTARHWQQPPPRGAAFGAHLPPTRGARCVRANTDRFNL